MILVTGALGSIGMHLVARLRTGGHEVITTDLDGMDVTDEDRVGFLLRFWRPEVIFHLAGAKHAPDGELDPFHVVNVNTIGTRNVLQHAGDAKVILASTCKAADPETAYGASKLIAERMVLNAGGSVARFYNIPEASGNVFRLWERLPEWEPIPWTDCWRYFVPMAVSIDLLMEMIEADSGRYAPIPGKPRHMRSVAEQLYPDRQLVQIARRRGDRIREPLHAISEWTSRYRTSPGMVRVGGPHDPGPVRVAELVAA